MVVLGPSNHSFCVTKSFTQDSEIKLSYVISGENEKAVKAAITNFKQKAIFEKINENNGDFHYLVQEEGDFKLCFNLINSDSESIVSFEYVNNLDILHISKLAKDDTFNSLNQNLTSISEMFDNLEQAVKYYAERSETHNKSILNVISLIKNVTVYKGLLIIFVGLLQVFIIRRFFGNTKVENISIKNPFSEDGI